jgi:hypothetical protein
VLGVGDGVADDVLEEDLEDTAGLFVDETRDTLHTSATGETADGGLSDTYEGRDERRASKNWARQTLDVVAENLAVTLSSTLSESLQHEW